MFLFKYIQFIHNYIYYSNFFVEGKENVPEKSEAVVIASCHQNAINDPLALEFAFANRTVNLFAHGNLFRNPIINRFFRSIHVIPAYRMRTDGEESLSKNFTEFENVEKKLFNGEWTGIFPEATNQSRRFLGEFSLGYLRMAFQAAERQNFEKDVKVLPVAIHYDNYHRFRHNCLVRIAPAVSLLPFYELYKTKPRTAQRQVNALVRESIQNMMIDLPDEESYEAIEYIRETYGRRYAVTHGANPDILPQKLSTDIKLTSILKAYADAKPEEAGKLFADVSELKSQTRKAGIRDWVLANKDSSWWLVLYCIMLLCLLPVFLYTLIPNLLIYLAPIPFCKKFDSIGGPFVMFKGGVQIVLSSLVTAPLLYTAGFILHGIYIGWLFAAIWTLLQPAALVFGWNYYNFALKTLSISRFRIGTLFASGKEKAASLRTLRASIWHKLDELCA
ncbi:MAG: 1-acyl-sn-glycerol-3-phosphate acyltransferase [Paludibacteraceae bacterium]|nr:1-acyl-sn-glycerol-3-phosphate acyltransferase [Paludibacteraceae bacterium]MDY6373476.1 1-acyl-sn-glycerol-3-phosphate acyltransferase [Bacteroidales bacterium]